MSISRTTRRWKLLAVFFLAGVVLLTETVLFHATKFVMDYALAMTVIACAVAGLALGAILAGRFRGSDIDLFALCCGGTTICYYLAAYALLQSGTLWHVVPATASVFVFPSIFIARAFADGDARGVYFADMLGAGTAVGTTVLAYQYLGSEAIYLLLLTVIPLAGAIGSAAGIRQKLRLRTVTGLSLLLLSAVGGAQLYRHLHSDAWNIVRLINPEAPHIPAVSMLRSPSRLTITRTYDNLVARIDAMPAASPADNRTFVTYDGFFNDNFFDYPAHDYAQYAQRHGIRFPQSDRRVLYGLVDEPHVFVIGAAADGILKTLREITPLDHIEAVEINPGILRLMQQDYLERSGRVYEGLQVHNGNALSLLQRSQRKYDVITLINVHSSRWIGALGAPDLLHTRESYDLMLDSLTDEGYLLFEERPATRQGELGVKRMILTLYDCLKRRGIENPSEHFFVWEYMSNRYTARGGEGIATGSDMYYVSMIVSLAPLRGVRREKLLEWANLEWTVVWDERQGPVHYPRKNRLYPAYLTDQWHGERFGPFFDLLAQGNPSATDPQFDASPATNDRPFVSCSTHSVPEIRNMVFVTAAICLFLGALIVLSGLVTSSVRAAWGQLAGYNVAIGAAYFLIEIMLIQSYQGVYLSPSTSLVLVLGILLIGSGLGGLAARHIPPWLATLALGPSLLLAISAPEFILARGWSTVQSGAMAALAILLVGMIMGLFFPAGLRMAQRVSLRSHIPRLFALNALAGALATVLSLYLAVRFGYTSTVIVAVALYALASVLYRWVEKISEAERSGGAARL